MSAGGRRPVETLVCARSVTPRDRAEDNEDVCASIRLSRDGVRGVVVADGLGSHARAGDAAREVVRSAAQWLRDETEDFGRGTLPRLFAHAHGQLRSHVRRETGEEPRPETWGTTLLVGLEAGAELVAAYAGNGAVWHLRGNFDAFTDAGLPWNAVNLLNPHTVQRHGREVLYTLVDAAQSCPPMPTVVSVRKDSTMGDILLLCTDGIYSADQVTHGTDGAGGQWVSAEAPMVACFRALRDLFAAWDGQAELPLDDALQACLDGLRTRGMLEDDATVGVIVTADALRYQRRARLAARAAEEAAAVVTSGGTDAGEAHAEPSRSADDGGPVEASGSPVPATRAEPADQADPADAIHSANAIRSADPIISADGMPAEFGNSTGGTTLVGSADWMTPADAVAAMSGAGSKDSAGLRDVVDSARGASADRGGAADQGVPARGGAPAVRGGSADRGAAADAGAWPGAADLPGAAGRAEAERTMDPAAAGGTARRGGEADGSHGGRERLAQEEEEECPASPASRA